MTARLAWRQATRHAAMLSILMLAPIAYWFGAANRYIVFLYGHMGADPFDPITTGRYWMAGLVSGGGALTLYTASCYLASRLAALRARRWEAPAPWRVWLAAALPTSAGVLVATMMLGAPTLPPGLALACTATTLVALAGASASGWLAATDPPGWLWLAADSLALVPPLLLLRLVSPDMRALIGNGIALAAAASSLLAALGWSAAMALLRRWRGRASPATAKLYAGGLIQAYLMLPLAHFALSDPGGPYYVTSAGNFFPTSPVLQVAILLAVWGLARATTRKRRR